MMWFLFLSVLNLFWRYKIIYLPATGGTIKTSYGIPVQAANSSPCMQRHNFHWESPEGTALSLFKITRFPPQLYSFQLIFIPLIFPKLLQCLLSLSFVVLQYLSFQDICLPSKSLSKSCKVAMSSRCCCVASSRVLVYHLLCIIQSISPCQVNQLLQIPFRYVRVHGFLSCVSLRYDSYAFSSSFLVNQCA